MIILSIELIIVILIIFGIVNTALLLDIQSVLNQVSDNFFGDSTVIMSQGHVVGVVIGCIVGVFIAGTAGLKGLDR
ncbi:hypothetical protein I8C35_002236 [Listeria monocytogenes]|nr:hypothetical protein [Listeria monocytogenes]